MKQQQKFVKFNKNLFLVQQPVVNTNKESKSKPINHIWEYDRSGSMSYILPQLCTDLKAQVRTLPIGDTITLGWFSSENKQFNFIVKGFKITDKADYKILENAIDKNNTTIGCTCFSEILEDTDNVIKDLSVISDTFSFMFYTDGYPIVSNYSREIERINSALEKISGKIASSLFVGQGNYYNKSLMSDMAVKLGSGLIHSEDMNSFNVSLHNFLKDSRESDGKIEVELDSLSSGKRIAVFGLNGEQINVYPENEKTVRFSPSNKNKDYVYSLQTNPPSNGEEIEFTDVNVRGKSSAVESIVKASFAASFILTQRTKTDQALEVLSNIGDKNLIDAVNNSFTNAEYGKAEEKIREAAFDSSRRFLQGRNTKYLPAADAFCLLDVVDILMEDENAKFYPFNEKFNYSRIGVKQEAKSEYPKFDADKSSACNLSTLVWNKEMLNLSMLANINGTVTLKGDASKVGLAPVYPTNIFRTFTLVKDGFLNMSSLPVSLSKSTFDTMKEKGLIDDSEKYTQEGIYELFLNRIPVINRAIADGKTSAKVLCQKAYQEIILEGKLKAFNFFKKQLEDSVRKSGVAGSSALSLAQEEFLKTNGIVRGSFNPPSVKADPTDFYYAKEFSVKIAKHSTLPSVNDAIKAVTTGKALTATQKLVNDGVLEYNSITAKLSDDKVKLAAIESAVVKTKKELITVRSDIQRTKFSIILGKRWFDEFNSRENCNLDVDGKSFTIDVREVKVDI